LIEFDAHRFGGVKQPCLCDQHLRKVGVDAPVVRVVGVGQSGFAHATAKAHMVELCLYGAEAGLDVAQTFAIGQLGEDHGQKLVPASKSARVRVATIADDTLLKFFVRQEFDQLRENGAAGVHAPLFRRHRGGGKTELNFKSFPIRVAASCCCA
jgi:hypothetical protein